MNKRAAEEQPEARQRQRVHMTAEEALAAAEAEGLPLIRSGASSSGYKHVSCRASNKFRPYTLVVEGKSLGSFATAEEAALTYSRLLGREKAAKADRVDMTTEQALAAAETEGLPLIRSGARSSGYKHVSWHHDRKVRAYFLVVEGKHVGTFATAEEAALTYSRRLGREAAEAEAASGRAASASRVDMTAKEALAAAETEGLPLIRSAAGSSGYKHVSYCRKKSTHRPYSVALEGKSLGSFATAEEAALSYSRHLGREAAEAEVAKSVQGQAPVSIQQDPALMKAFVEQAEAKAREEKAKERERERRAAKEAAKAREKEAAKAVFEEHKRQQAAREELMAQRQRAMLQEAAERQRQRTAGSSRPGPSAPPAAAATTPSAPPGDVPTAALIKQVLRDRASAHLCLGVDFFAPRDVVRKRYLALVLRLHPDKVAHPHAAEAFAAVEAAFRRLCGG